MLPSSSLSPNRKTGVIHSGTGSILSRSSRSHSGSGGRDSAYWMSISTFSSREAQEKSSTISCSFSGRLINLLPLRSQRTQSFFVQGKNLCIFTKFFVNSVCSVVHLRLLFYRRIHQVAPFRPGTVIVPDVGIPHQILEHEPG